MAEWMEASPSHRYLLLLAPQFPTDPCFAHLPLTTKLLLLASVYILWDPRCFSFQCWAEAFKDPEAGLNLWLGKDPGIFGLFLQNHTESGLSMKFAIFPVTTPRCKSGVFSVSGTSTLNEGSAGVCFMRSRHVQHAFSGIYRRLALLIPGLTVSPGEHLAKSGDTFGCQMWTRVLVSSVPMPRMFLNILSCSGWLPPSFGQLVPKFQ